MPVLPLEAQAHRAHNIPTPIGQGLGKVGRFKAIGAKRLESVRPSRHSAMTPAGGIK